MGNELRRLKSWQEIAWPANIFCKFTNMFLHFLKMVLNTFQNNFP